FFSSRRRHTRSKRDWSSDVCSSDLKMEIETSYSTEDLYNTTQKLVANTNALHTDLAFADSLVVSPHTKKNIRAIASQGYERIPTYILSTNKIPSIAKNSLFSLTLSYMG